jgi:hypothetical protein
MRAVKRGLTLVGLILAITGGGLRALAQLVTTTVQDTVYSANGTPASGSVVISWNSFTTANGVAVAAGTTTATIGANGLLSVALAPNAGSVPMGTYYTVVFHLSDGTTTREYWSVPVTVPGGGPATLAGVSTTVLPASVAMQTVTKAYVDNAIAAVQSGMPDDQSPYVLKAGDTMTGPLNLPADPVNPSQAADMHYVDASVAAVAAGAGGKVALNPGVTQVVAQPAGTQMQVNDLNGDLYASQYVSGSGNNGIANALASAGCGSGCELKVEPTYATGESVSVGELPQLTQVVDGRGGSQVHVSVDPLGMNSYGNSAAVAVENTSTRSAAQLAAQLGSVNQSSYALELSNSALTGGNNDYPENLGSGIPYFKSTFGVESLTGNYNTQGQHVQVGNKVNCYGVGDCLAGGQFIVTDGGLRDSADEGTHPFDLQVLEDSSTFAGTCTSGCTTGSTQVTIASTADAGTQGDGRFLIDKNPADVISTGSLIGGTTTFSPLANFSGTSFPVSVFVELAAPAVAQPRNVAPGTVTLPIATSGAPSGFAVSTAALPATGVACLAETIGGIANFEMANYSVVDGTHVQLTLNRVHGTATAMAVGGMCGYGLEETVDTVGAVRQVFPVLGSSSATSLYYAGGVANIVGVKGQTGAFLNDTFSVASISRTGNVVTVTATANFADDVNGLSMTVSGVADSSYDGTYTVTTTGPNTLTYADTGANSTSSGGSLNVLTGGYALYPLAEVLSVYDAATKSVDGAMTLGANTVPWASGDAVEEPHFHLQRVAADVEYVTQYEPRDTARQSAGKTYQGKVSNYLVGWEISNADPATDYMGSGGTLTPPTDAYSVRGYWANDMEVEAGRDAVIHAHCNARGCNRWDSGYALFAMDSATGVDTLGYAPESDTVTWTLDGTSYGFSPSAFTAGTINVGTLNATTITGGVSGAAITSGTISAARLPVFGASGASHAVGAVPDPGATAGSTRFLREDGTWSTPSGSGGSATANSLAGGVAYAIPYQSAANTTAMLGSPAAGVSFLSENGTAAPAWTNAATWLASPGAIGGTAPGTGAFSGGTAQTALSATSSSGTSTVLSLSNTSGSGNTYNIEIPGSSAGYTSDGLIYHDVTHSVYPFWYSGGAGPGIWTVSTGIFGWSSNATNPDTSGTLDTGMYRSAAGVICASASPTTYPNPPCSGTFQAANLKATTAVTTAQVIASGSAPAIANGGSAGTSAGTPSVTGANMAGVITVTTGTSPGSAGTLATVAFSGTLATAPQGCSLMARNAAAASATGTVYTTAPTTTGWSIAVGGTALGAASVYSWSYVCM